MKTTLTYTSRNTAAPWPALLTQQLVHWHTLTTITNAEIVLEHNRDSARAFRVKVRLDGVIPCFRSDVSDSTLEGALVKTTQDLERQIDLRNNPPPGHGKGTKQSGKRARHETGRGLPG